MKTRTTALAIDFETFVDNGYDIRKLGLDRYVADERFRVLSVAIWGDAGLVYCGPAEAAPWDALPRAERLIAHNIAFERAVLTRLGKDPGPIQRWRDTAALSRYLQAPGNLDDASRLLLPDLPPKVQIDLKDRPQTDEALLNYNAHDARLAFELWKRHGPLWPEHEQQLAGMTAAWGERGVTIDQQYARECVEKCVSIMEEAQGRLPWFPQYKPTSPKGVRAECERLGIPVPPPKSKDEEGFAQWCSQYADQAPWVVEMGRYRSANALKKRCETLLHRLRPDGRVRAELYYCGAWTGRWTSAGGVNFQNQRRKPFEGIEIRNVIIPAAGRTLCVADLGQIEARIINWLAGNPRMMDLLAQGFDPYQGTALQLSLWDGRSELSEAVRQVCKQAALSLGYGVGGDRFAEIAGLPAEAAHDFVWRWRDANPEIVSLWGRMENTMRARIGRDWGLLLPSGRMLRFGKISESLRGELEAVVIRGKSPERFWGSRIAQAATQALARDVFAQGLLRLQDLPDVHVLFTSHDEVVTEVPGFRAEDCERDIAKALTTRPVWALSLPLTAKTALLTAYEKA